MIALPADRQPDPGKERLAAGRARGVVRAEPGFQGYVRDVWSQIRM